MGGLLAAEAATLTSSRRVDLRHRIIGLIAFDVPYLGMHPHVIISGIASLFPDDDREEKKSEREMNAHGNIQFVDPKVTDDWEAYKQEVGTSYSLPSIHPRDGPPSPLPGSSPPSTPFLQKTIDFIASHSNDSVARWVHKHADDPISAGRRFVVERFQFGSAMFNPSELKDRYSQLVAWDGPWVNYWTSTVSKKKVNAQVDETESRGSIPDTENEWALRQIISSAGTSISDGTSVTSTHEEEKRAAKEQEKLRKKADKERKATEKAQAKKDRMTTPRHFVVLPNGLGSILGGMDKWEKVFIAGVDDEVGAHCGLFIPSQNLEYDALKERVANKAIGFIRRM